MTMERNVAGYHDVRRTKATSRGCSMMRHKFGMCRSMLNVIERVIGKARAASATLRSERALIPERG
jgi:hypothetical protein